MRTPPPPPPPQQWPPWYPIDDNATSKNGVMFVHTALIHAFLQVLPRFSYSLAHSLSPRDNYTLYVIRYLWQSMNVYYALALDHGWRR